MTVSGKRCRSFDVTSRDYMARIPGCTITTHPRIRFTYFCIVTQSRDVATENARIMTKRVNQWDSRKTAVSLYDLQLLQGYLIRNVTPADAWIEVDLQSIDM